MNVVILLFNAVELLGMAQRLHRVQSLHSRELAVRTARQMEIDREPAA
jgi:hypothetical protein